MLIVLALLLSSALSFVLVLRFGSCVILLRNIYSGWLLQGPAFLFYSGEVPIPKLLDHISGSSPFAPFLSLFMPRPIIRVKVVSWSARLLVLRPLQVSHTANYLLASHHRLLVEVLLRFMPSWSQQVQAAGVAVHPRTGYARHQNWPLSLNFLYLLATTLTQSQLQRDLCQNFCFYWD